MMMGYGYGMGWMMIIPLILVVLIVVWILKLTNRHSPNDMRHENALETLDRKYANGEITEEQYLRMKENILRH